jgi:hypothetical protein
VAAQKVGEASQAAVYAGVPPGRADEKRAAPVAAQETYEASLVAMDAAGLCESGGRRWQHMWLYRRQVKHPCRELDKRETAVAALK